MRLSGKVDKGWGWEDIWVTSDKYCSKFLHFNEGAKFSMHFHAEKEETWYVLEGKFIVSWIDTDTAERYSKEAVQGDIIHNPPLTPHQLHCIEKGIILEVSTPDSVRDNYRVEPGDSQSRGGAEVSALDS
jgi:mannose-6-phosphate isomerase-like protein (cupin superfamily)